MALSTEEYKWLHGTLQKIDFLSVLTIGQLDQLTTYIYKKAYKKKTTIFKQGDTGDFFYIIFKGSVGIWAALKGGRKRHIASLIEGNYFGEMALVSGDPRSADVITENDAELFLLFKNDFNALLRDNPGLDQRVKDVIARRQAQRSVELAHPSESKSGIIAKILEFFGFSS